MRRPDNSVNPFWFWKRIDFQIGGCWLWTGSRNNIGYGTLLWDKKPITAHRLAFDFLIGKIENHLELDHLCKVRHCVNPLHLEPVTHEENVLRGDSPSAIHARKTHCKRGHLLAGENLVLFEKPNGRFARVCLTCRRSYHRVYQANWKAKRYGSH